MQLPATVTCHSLASPAAPRRNTPAGLWARVRTRTSSACQLSSDSCRATRRSAPNTRVRGPIPFMASPRGISSPQSVISGISVISGNLYACAAYTRLDQAPSFSWGFWEVSASAGRTWATVATCISTSRRSFIFADTRSHPKGRKSPPAPRPPLWCITTALEMVAAAGTPGKMKVSHVDAYGHAFDHPPASFTRQPNHVRQPHGTVMKHPPGESVSPGAHERRCVHHVTCNRNVYRLGDHRNLGRGSCVSGKGPHAGHQKSNPAALADRDAFQTCMRLVPFGLGVLAAGLGWVGLIRDGRRVGIGIDTTQQRDTTVPRRASVHMSSRLTNG